MIISQTPLRVSFAGGGSDLPSFYTRESGAVLSTTINKYMFVTVNPRFDPTIRVSYSKTEIAESVDEIRHTIVREALRLMGLRGHLEITTIGDVPAGTGLGSSSALAVGLLNVLYAYKGLIAGPRQLAEQACEIEIDILKKPIGRQDQYAAAYGGLNYMRFNGDDSVDVEAVPCNAETLGELERRILLIYTNEQHKADRILKHQSAGTKQCMPVLREMRDLANQMRNVLTRDGDLDEFARLVHTGWELKRSLGFGISHEKIDQCYEAARRAGAQGGKLLGAGGGGFLFLVAPPERHAAIREVLGSPRELDFGIDRRGGRIIFISD